MALCVIVCVLTYVWIEYNKNKEEKKHVTDMISLDEGSKNSSSVDTWGTWWLVPGFPKVNKMQSVIILKDKMCFL